MTSTNAKLAATLSAAEAMVAAAKGTGMEDAAHDTLHRAETAILTAQRPDLPLHVIRARIATRVLRTAFDSDGASPFIEHLAASLDALAAAAGVTVQAGELVPA